MKEGLRQLGHTAAAEKSIHYSYEMVALTPETAQALGIEISEEDAKKPYLEMSGRKGFGVKADDLIDALQAKATEAVRGGERRGAFSSDEVERTLGARSPSVRSATSCSSTAATRSSPSTSMRR